ncbi:hypothetical protein AAMO2058_000471200 [Amorphochlora amoebiformis]
MTACPRSSVSLRTLASTLLLSCIPLTSALAPRGVQVAQKSVSLSRVATAGRSTLFSRTIARPWGEVHRHGVETDKALPLRGQEPLAMVASPSRARLGSGSQVARASVVSVATTANPSGMDKSSGMSKLIFLAGSAIILSAVNNLLVEALFRGEAPIDASLWNLLNWSMYFVCALIERIVFRLRGFKGKITDYMKLGALTATGNYFTYAALHYVNYTIRVLFKAAKVVPVMLVSAIYVGKKYSMAEYLNVLILVLSITFFSYGDAATAGAATSKFDIRGIGMLGIGVVADALVSNFEEKKLFGERGASGNEVMLVTSFISAIYIAIAMFASGQIWTAIEYVKARPDIVQKAFIACTAGYGSLSMSLRIIQNFGAVTAETNKALRRLITVFASIIQYKKPFETFHMIGTALFGTFLLGSFKIKVDKSKRKQQAAIGGDDKLGTVPAT